MSTPLCSRNLPSIWSMASEANWRYWGYVTVKLCLDFSLSVRVSNILPHCTHELSKHAPHFSVSISKLHFLHGLFNPEAAQKFSDNAPDFGVWKMFTLRKVTDQQLFCSIQQNEHIKPVSCMEVPVLGTGGVIDAVVDSGIPELEGPHPHC